MKILPKKIIFVILEIGLQTFLFSCNSRSKSEELIRNCFETYKSSIINEEYEKASDCIDSRSTNYYEGILKHVLHSDSVIIESLPFFDKFFIILSRASISKKELEHLDGKSYFALLLSKGFV